VERKHRGRYKKRPIRRSAQTQVAQQCVEGATRETRAPLTRTLGPMSKQFILLAAAFSFAVGCSSTKSSEIDEAQCKRTEGEWRRVCIAQRFTCVKAYSDAGKRCRDSSECEGECIVDFTVRCEAPGQCSEELPVPAPGSEVTGTCQRNDDPCGSFVIVRGGKAQPIFHRD
jgi:hypothetical protein